MCQLLMIVRPCAVSTVADYSGDFTTRPTLPCHLFQCFCYLALPQCSLTRCVYLFLLFFFKFLVFEGAIYANKDVYIIFGGRLISWLLGSAASVELAHSLAHEVAVTRRCCLSLGEVQRVCSPRGGDLLCHREQPSDLFNWLPCRKSTAPAARTPLYSSTIASISSPIYTVSVHSKTRI